ncbi:hypothetical protein ACHAXM_010695 [Skeletonema potamos]
MKTSAVANSISDCLEEASRVVELIRRQLTEGDAPSGNFDNYPDNIISRNKTGDIHDNSNIIIHYNNDNASATASEEPSVVSSSSGGQPRAKQLKFLPPRPPSSDTSSRSSFTNNTSANSSKHVSGLSIICSSNTSFTIGSHLMGTSALADLCAQTVQSIARNNYHDSSSEHVQNTSLQQHNNNNDAQKDGTSNIVWDDTDINNMDSFSFEVEEEHEQSTYNKKASLMTTEGRIIMEQSALGHNGTGNNPKRRRTVMFGSEYARILSSSSPLSPSSNNCQRAKNARRMKQSIKARFTSSSSSSSSLNKESVESGGSSLILSLDDCPNAVATAAITDVIITSGSHVIPPKGYYRAFPIGKKKDELLYVNVKKEPHWDRAVQRPCVTAICVIYPDRNEFVPPGFSVVRYYQATTDDKIADNSNNNSGSLASPANVNPSTSGERVYLCYRRSREGNPLTGLTCLQPSKGDVIPEGYTVLEKTPRNFLADMTANSDQPLFLAYRQRLENLECLRPLPLVLSVIQSKQDLARKELKAYYCTGGTIVASDVGRFHIMDRSTHNILSSSSAQSRLSVIQMARAGSSGSGTAVPSWITSSSSHSSLSQMKEKWEGDLREDPNSFFGDGNSVESSPSQKSLASLGTPNSKINSPLLRQFDDTVQTSLDTMQFIPSIERANSNMSESILQSRIAIISPILTACYTSQGGSALLAVEGLTKLLNDTDFFAQDVADAENVIDTSSRLTLIDLAVQVVCDVATSTSRETYFRSCVDFVSDAVRYANGRLNDRTTGFIMRFYLFVYYFGASVPTSGWPFIRDGYLLSDEIGDSIVGVYLPGGAPQAAAIALREFVTIMVASIGSNKEAEGKEKESDDLSGPSNTEDETNSIESQSRMVTSNSKSAENAIDSVDLANYTQLALYQIHRSGGSELFWHDMINQCGMGLFGSNASSNQMSIHANIISFAILASLVKIASGKVRIISKNADPVPRDVASKLLSLELLFHFIKVWHAAVCPEGTAVNFTGESDLFESSILSERNDTKATTTMVYLIRRMVVPTMLSNTSASIEDCRVYRRVLQITSQLWCNPYYRRNMKVDLAILIEHFVLKIICLGPQINPSKGSFDDGNIPNVSGEMPSLLDQQLAVLEELKVWFSNPNSAVDLYVNYDSPEEMLPSAYCKLLNKLIEALCTLGERCAAIVSDHGRFTSISSSPKRSSSIRKENDMAHVREAALEMRNKCFDVIALVVKSMMDCSDTHPQNQHHLLHSHSQSDLSDIAQSFSNEMSPPLAMLGISADENIVDYWRTSIEKRKAPLHPIVSALSEDMTQSTASLLELKQSRSGDSRIQKPESLEIALELISRKGMKQGIDYLIAKHLLTRSPKHVSSFLRVHQTSIDPVVLGEYLGEGGIDGIDKDYWNLIRFYYVRAVSFVGMNIEKALRHFLTNCGFRLPGEAQRIDRVISTFSQCYWEDNAGDMANCPFQDQDTCFLVSFAIIMLNTDLHKSQPTKSKTLKRMTRSEFIANLRHVCAADKFQSYIYDIYDAIEKSPILMSQNSPRQEGKRKRRGQGPTSSLPFKHDQDYATSLQAWVKSAKSTQELLRTLDDQNDNDLKSSDDQSDEGADLWYVTHQIFSANWHHIHGLINATVENAHIDISGLDAAIAALEYSLCTASRLDMTIELAAFNKLLERFNRFNGLKVHKEDGPWRSSDDDATTIKAAESSFTENTDQVRNLTKQLQTSLFVDDTKVQTMKLVANRIRNGEVLLNDPSRTFVREGDLIKRHQLAGRSSTYRFFLFSDVLVYAHKSSQGDYVVHEELPLHLMKIEDIDFQSSKSKHHSFFIHHPNKSFAVNTSGKAEKKLWMEDIKNSISCEISRKAKVEGARLERVKKSVQKNESKKS